MPKFEFCLPTLGKAVGDRTAQERFFELGISDGSFRSSAARFQSDSEVRATDFVVGRFAGARRPEFEWRCDSSLSAASIRVISDGRKTLSRPAGV
jgi:hypothetical protein